MVVSVFALLVPKSLAISWRSRCSSARTLITRLIGIGFAGDRRTLLDSLIKAQKQNWKPLKPNHTQMDEHLEVTKR